MLGTRTIYESSGSKVVALPPEVRRRLSLNAGDELGFRMDEDSDQCIIFPAEVKKRD